MLMFTLSTGKPQNLLQQAISFSVMVVHEYACVLRLVKPDALQVMRLSVKCEFLQPGNAKVFIYTLKTLIALSVKHYG